MIFLYVFRLLAMKDAVDWSFPFLHGTHRPSSSTRNWTPKILQRPNSGTRSGWRPLPLSGLLTADSVPRRHVIRLCLPLGYVAPRSIVTVLLTLNGFRLVIPDLVVRYFLRYRNQFYNNVHQCDKYACAMLFNRRQYCAIIAQCKK